MPDGVRKESKNWKENSMICRRCQKREAMPDDPFCVVCDEQLFDARVERDEARREKREEEGRRVD